MKIFSKIMLALIFVFLIGISVAGEIIIDNGLTQAMNDCLYLENISQNQQDLRLQKIALAVDDLEYHWKENESKMCFLVNHKNIQEIGLEISKMKVYQQENDVKEFKACLDAVKFYSQSYLHFMGANLHNVL